MLLTPVKTLFLFKLCIYKSIVHLFHCNQIKTQCWWSQKQRYYQDCMHQNQNWR